MPYDQWVGTAGVTLILAAYFCSTFGWLSPRSRGFFLLNATGAAAACYASWLISYWPFVVLEGTWTLVSVVGLARRKKS